MKNELPGSPVQCRGETALRCRGARKPCGGRSCGRQLPRILAVSFPKLYSNIRAISVRFVYLVLGVLPAFAGNRDVPIRLYHQFQQEPPAAVLESLEADLDEIMFPVGLSLEWRSLAVNTGREASVELVVIHFNGECDANDFQPIYGYPGPLGWTHVNDGEILPFIGINCDGIRIFLQRRLLGFPEQARASTYRRAVARVLAHELYHVLLRTAKHGSSGIGKACYSVEELLSDEFRFSKKQSDALSAHGAFLRQRVPMRSSD